MVICSQVSTDNVPGKNQFQKLMNIQVDLLIFLSPISTCNNFYVQYCPSFIHHHKIGKLDLLLHARIITEKLLTVKSYLYSLDYINFQVKPYCCGCREKMVAALIASGASAVAVTDPNSQDPAGKTPASIAATCGHRGLAGYLSEVALTSHLSSLTLKESELSKGSAALEAERTVNSISNGSSSSTFEDQDSLRHTLAAVRNATQAAARIQSAFRAHSFRKRQHREAAAAIADASGDEFSLLENDIQGLSAASKLAFRYSREYNLAALSIQKKYRGWKGRRDFLALRQKVVKIQVCHFLM